MKNLIYFGLMCFFCVPTYAAIRCIPFSRSADCTAASPAGQIDWYTSCGGIYVKGIGQCASTPGSSTGETRSGLELSDTNGSNVYCWCKMIEPAHSRWVFRYDMGGEDGCLYGCAAQCGRFFVERQEFRNAVLGKLE